MTDGWGIFWTGEPDIELQLDDMFDEDSDEQLDKKTREKVIAEVMNRMDWEKLVEDSISLGNERICDLIQEVLAEQEPDTSDFELNDFADFGGNEHYWFDVPSPVADRDGTMTSYDWSPLELKADMISALVKKARKTIEAKQNRKHNG